MTGFNHNNFPKITWYVYSVCLHIFFSPQPPLLMSIYLDSLDLLTSTLSLHPTTLSSAPSLSPASKKLLVKHISTLPPGQCIEILNLFHRYFTKQVTFGESGGDGLSLSEQPLLIKRIPSLEKAADMLCVLLDNVPSSVWTSHLKGKALEALLKLHRDVCLPFLEAKCTKVSTYCISIGFLLCI